MGQAPDDSTETELLLQQAGQGDCAAFEVLFAKHRAFLRTVVDLRMHDRLRQRLDPSDVIQEAFTEAFQRLSDFLSRRPMSFRLWLRKTAQERLSKLQQQHLEAERRAITREIVLPERSSLLLARRLCLRNSTPLDRAIRKEMTNLVHQALSQLPTPDREVLLMRYVEKLSNQEIGSVLELKPETVSKRHGRALIKLQQILKDFGIEGISE